MKKLTVMLLTLAMAASMTACSSSNKETTAASTAAATTAAQTEAATDAATEAATDAATEATADDDLAYVTGKGTLVVGITDFEPMDYLDENKNWIGFDADMATKFAESLGVSVEFIEIEWDNKVFELDSKAIDCVWNGMTLTPEVTAAMDCSTAYCNNAQVVVVNKDVADQYTTAESIVDLAFAVESGSAGAEVLDGLNIPYTEVSSQANALMEVAAGTSDACVIDALMAAAMVGEGTGYENLTYTVALNSEEYGVGFRKGSALAEMCTDFIMECYDNGTAGELAEKYGITAAMIQ